MNRITLDKVASAATNAPITTDAFISPEVVARPGYVVAVRTSPTRRSTTSSRM